MKILCFGYDEALLEPEDAASENQYRQRRYCELLDQERSFIVLGRFASRETRSLARGKVRAEGAGARTKAGQAMAGFFRGLRRGRDWKPDAVEYQDPMLAGLVAWAVSRLLQKPLLGGLFNDFTDNPAWIGRSSRRRLYNAVGKWVLGRTLRVRCDSEKTALDLQGKGYPQVRYVPFFIPWLDLFEATPEDARARLATWREEPLVLCAARLAEEKNIALLLRALARVWTGGRRGRLVVVGGGPLEKELKHLAAQLGIADGVEWAGPARYQALAGYFRQAHIFTLPSHSETSARVLVLAQAAGLPTVTTDTSGCREIVRHGTNGFVTPLGDEGAFASALEDLLTQEPLYRRMMSAAGSAGFRERFGDPMILSELKNFYEPAGGENA